MVGLDTDMVGVGSRSTSALSFRQVFFFVATNQTPPHPFTFSHPTYTTNNTNMALSTMLQIMAFGGPDSVIYDDPQSTSWRYVHMRHTKHAIDNASVQLSGTQRTGNSTVTNFPREGDLITYQVITLEIVYECVPAYQLGQQHTVFILPEAYPGDT